jgi:hypothetical protein
MLSPLRLISLLALFPSVALSAGNAKRHQSKDVASIEAANRKVDELERRITAKDKSLPTLQVEYDFHDATEGVPPDFKFYFESGKAGDAEKPVLRACRTHVGHEVYSKDYTYYFDEKGNPLKFLAMNSGVSGEGGFPASRDGIIYDGANHVIWSSGKSTPPLSFNEIKVLFISLDKSLKSF